MTWVKICFERLFQILIHNDIATVNRDMNFEKSLTTSRRRPLSMLGHSLWLGQVLAGDTHAMQLWQLLQLLEAIGHPAHLARPALMHDDRGQGPLGSLWSLHMTSTVGLVYSSFPFALCGVSFFGQQLTFSTRHLVIKGDLLGLGRKTYTLVRHCQRHRFRFNSMSGQLMPECLTCVVIINVRVFTYLMPQIRL